MMKKMPIQNSLQTILTELRLGIVSSGYSSSGGPWLMRREVDYKHLMDKFNNIKKRDGRHIHPG